MTDKTALQDITDAQIAAGAEIIGSNGKPVGRNTAIDVFHAMSAQAWKGGA